MIWPPAVTVRPPAVTVSAERVVTAPALLTKRLSLALAVSRTANEVAPGTSREAAAPRVRLPAVTATSPAVAVTPPAVATSPARAVTSPALLTSRLSAPLALLRTDIDRRAHV